MSIFNRPTAETLKLFNATSKLPVSTLSSKLAKRALSLNKLYVPSQMCGESATVTQYCNSLVFDFADYNTSVSVKTKHPHASSPAAYAAAVREASAALFRLAAALECAAISADELSDESLGVIPECTEEDVANEASLASDYRRNREDGPCC